MLIIVNPYATTVSDRLKNLVVYALQGRYEVEAVSTEAQNHATEIGREAIDGGYDVVVAFGGDGTLNEVANGLAGTDVPVSVLPGGSTNVVAARSGSPTTSSTRPSTCSGSPTTSSPAGSTSGSPTGATSSSPAAPASTRPAAMRVDAQAEAEGDGRAVLLHLGRGLRLLSRLPAQPGPDAARGRPATAEGVTRSGPELRPVHLLRQPPGARLRGRRDRRRHALGRGPAPRRSARHADRSSPGCSPSACGLPGTARSTTSTTSPRPAIESVSTDDRGGDARPFPVQVDGDYIGDHAELDAGDRSRRADDHRLSADPDCRFCCDRRRRDDAARSSSRTRSRSPSSTSGRSFTATRCSSRAPITRRSPDLPAELIEPLLRQRPACCRPPCRDGDGRTGLVRRDQQHRQPARPAPAHARRPPGARRTACAGSSGRGPSTRTTTTQPRPRS